MKRQRRSDICFWCDHDNVDCDGKRPCSRCANQGRTTACIGYELIKKTEERQAQSGYSTRQRERQILESNNHNTILFCVVFYFISLPISIDFNDFEFIIYYFFYSMIVFKLKCC
jgi:hypothetical protein